jgi:hypothetical protein
MNRKTIHCLVLFIGSLALFHTALAPASAQVNLPADAGFRQDRILVKPDLQSALSLP